MSRSVLDGGRATPSASAGGDLPVGARAVLCLWGGLYVIALLWAFPAQRPEFTVGLIAVFALARCSTLSSMRS